jgi:ATP-dependent RNA helicase DBP3
VGLLWCGRCVILFSSGRLFNLLRKLIAGQKKGKVSDEVSRVLVFVLYKKEASRVEMAIRRQGYSVAGLHGDLSQQQRIAALNNFKEGKTQLLVATDVAARGLDIPNVQAVINYSFPLTIEDYVHRIGRTGKKAARALSYDADGIGIHCRAGRKGRRVFHVLHW